MEDGDIANNEEQSDYCASVESYHSLCSSEDDSQQCFDYEGEFYSYDRNNPIIEVGAQYPNVVAFRRALSHYAVTKDFEFDLEKSDLTRLTAKCATRECSWRIHASVSDDLVTFIVRSLRCEHTCSGVNKRGNKHANEGWVADRVIDELRSEGNISAQELKKKIEKKFGIELPYLKVWRGKEIAMEEMHGKWEDSFTQIGALKEEIARRNPGSIVALETEDRHFQRFFIAMEACITGFRNGCRPYIGIDACHLKGKWKGVLAAATAVDGNNWMYPVAFAVMENESEVSWVWFLRKLHEAIGMPEGLVISSDMQKGLVEALSTVYPVAEHRECMRHLFSNFKKHFSGDIFKFGLWAAARTYSTVRFEKIIAELEESCPEALVYLRKEHNKIWSRSQFGSVSKCDYLTNNISETFNSWILEERQKPILDLLDSIRQKIMVRFNKKRRIANKWRGSLVPKVEEYITNISRDLSGYGVHRNLDNCAEVHRNGKRWEVNLDERMCTCRAWQVKGVPCVHAAAFIATRRNAKWEDYVDSHFTVDRFKAAYALGIAPMPSKHEWVNHDLGFKLLPPIMKRPTGRPRKRRIKASDETRKKRSNKCSRCGLPGHHKNTCKNAVPLEEHEGASQVTQESTNIGGGNKCKRKRPNKRPCTANLFKLLQEEDEM